MLLQLLIRWIPVLEHWSSPCRRFECRKPSLLSLSISHTIARCVSSKSTRIIPMHPIIAHNSPGNLSTARPSQCRGSRMAPAISYDRRGDFRSCDVVVGCVGTYHRYRAVWMSITLYCWDRRFALKSIMLDAFSSKSRWLPELRTLMARCYLIHATTQT